MKGQQTYSIQINLSHNFTPISLALWCCLLGTWILNCFPSGRCKILMWRFQDLFLESHHFTYLWLDRLVIRTRNHFRIAGNGILLLLPNPAEMEFYSGISNRIHIELNNKNQARTQGQIYSQYVFSVASCCSLSTFRIQSTIRTRDLFLGVLELRFISDEEICY